MVAIKDFGKIDSIHFAYATDEDVRVRASSGGFVKSFLIYLLESRRSTRRTSLGFSTIVDFAIITRTGGVDCPLIPETIITNSKDDILSTRTNSVYMINNPFAIFDRLESESTYAFVGLPCHIKRLRAYQKNGKYRNITVVIALFCHHTPNAEFTRDILQKLNVKEQDIRQIEYRGSGWPGGFTAYLKNGDRRFIEASQYWSNDLNNGPKRCKYCPEIAEEADVYVGDPWNLGFQRTDSKGMSLVICRNDYASTLVKGAEEAGLLKTYECSPEQLVQSQGYHIAEKIARRRKASVMRSLLKTVFTNR